MVFLSGDVLELSSTTEKATVLNRPAHREDFEKGLIRIDGYIRKKLDVSINERIEVKKVTAKDAQAITLAPRVIEDHGSRRIFVAYTKRPTRN
jgi:transitional endoplasmic reticulum ATPase